MSEGRFATLTTDYSLVSMMLNVARAPLPAGVEAPLK